MGAGAAVGLGVGAAAAVGAGAFAAHQLAPGIMISYIYFVFIAYSTL